jgi:ATP-dependent RNA helicase DDX18/HAS1
LIEKNFFLHKSAKDAFRSYLQAYASHQQRSIFDVQTLDLQKVGVEFGFRTPPSVNLNVSGGKTAAAAYKKKGGIKQNDKIQ